MLPEDAFFCGNIIVVMVCGFLGNVIINYSFHKRVYISFHLGQENAAASNSKANRKPHQ